MYFKKALLGSLFALASVTAQAAITYGTGSLSASFITLSSSNVAGGALYTSHALPPAAIPYNESPGEILTSGMWLAAGPGNTNNGGNDAVLSLGAGITGVSFLWGSPDDYNSFKFTTTLGTAILKATALDAALGNPFALDGNQKHAFYISLTATGGETISALTFQSSTNAIEIANVSAVPEPEANALALAGLGVVFGGMSTRRCREA